MAAVAKIIASYHRNKIKVIFAMAQIYNITNRVLKSLNDLKFLGYLFFILGLYTASRNILKRIANITVI